MAKGKLSASLEQWLRIVKAAPADLGARQKVGDLLARLGKKSEAIAAYLDVSKRYAEGGQFFKAIALCKVILTLDAEHKAAHQYLADLYSKARAPSAPAAPAAKPAPMAPLELQGLDTRAGRWIDDSDFVESVEAVEEVEPELLLEVEVEAPAPPLMGAPAALPVIPLFSQLSRDEFIAVLKAGMEVRSFSPGLEIVKLASLRQS